MRGVLAHSARAHTVDCPRAFALLGVLCGGGGGGCTKPPLRLMLVLLVLLWSEICS